MTTPTPEVMKRVAALEKQRRAGALVRHLRETGDLTGDRFELRMIGRADDVLDIFVTEQVLSRQDLAQQPSKKEEPRS